MDYERLVVENLPLVDSVVRLIARRHRLSADEGDELAGAIRLKLVENDYQVLRKFEGRSQLRTSLITVVQRHFLDDRSARWGKWRPSSIARRIGPIAVLLDQLLTRDRLPFDEAVTAIQTRYDDVSREQLHEIMLQLPARSARQFTSDEELEQVAAQTPNEDRVIASLERMPAGDRIERALDTVLANLGEEDRVILKMRFCDNVRIARIAELMGQAAKPFYRRLEDLMRILRNELQRQGVSAEDVANIIGDPASGIGEVLGPAGVGKTGGRPSVP